MTTKEQCYEKDLEIMEIYMQCDKLGHIYVNLKNKWKDIISMLQLI